MPRTLGAEIPRTTPTGKSTPIVKLVFEKNCYERVRRIICVGMDGVKLGMELGRNGIQKFDFDKVIL